jgi:hypothetical protein
MTVRICMGYRTVACEAACAIAGALPWPILAKAYSALYKEKAEIRAGRDGISLDHRKTELLRARRRAIEEWQRELEHPSAGKRADEAIRPFRKNWADHKPGGLSFHLTQVLTGHGCFGEYLCRIARESDERSHHCEETRDTAQHTLEFCPAWAEQHRVLRQTIGEDLSLPVIAKAMVDSEVNWRAVVSFCEDVLSQKEAAERVREADPSAEWPFLPDPQKKRREKAEKI